MDTITNPRKRKHNTVRIMRFAALLLLLFIVTIGTVYAADVNEATDTGNKDGTTFLTHNDSHKEGNDYGINKDTETDCTTIEAYCTYKDGDSVCDYYYSPRIYLYVDDSKATYNGSSYGTHFAWAFAKGSDTSMHEGFPQYYEVRGCTLLGLQYQGTTGAGETYDSSDPPTLPGDYLANAWIMFDRLGDDILYSHEYTIEPREITLNWGDEAIFDYDGQPHAPTVEIAQNEILEGDDVSVTRTTEIAAGVHTSEAQLTGRDSWKYTIKSDCRSKDYVITAPYDVHFDANPPENASTKKYLKGSMVNQHLEYGEEQQLRPNSFELPGYDFDGWNTEPDGSGTGYDDKERVKNLSETGNTVTLYAKWKKQEYTIYFDFGKEGHTFTPHMQTLEFDTSGTLDIYSDDSFGWTAPQNAVLHGWYWDDHGVGSFFADGAGCINLCEKSPEGGPQLDGNGNVIGAKLVAEWANASQITVSVPLDGTPQSNLKDYFTLVSGSETYTVDWVYDKDRYIFDPANQPPGPGGIAAQLPPGEYDLVFDPGKTDPGDPLYKFARSSIHIQYGEAYAVRTTFSYNTVSLAPDPAYEDLHKVDISGGRLISDDPKTVVALAGSKLKIKTMIDPGYHFDGYSVSGVTPGWDPDKAEQEITVQGKADIMAHIDANVYTVKFNANATSGVSGKMEDQDMVYDQPQNLFPNQFTRVGGTFAGWNTKKDGSGTAFEDGARIKDDNQDSLAPAKNGGTVTLYAQWNMNMFEVIFETNGGSAVDKQVVKNHEKVRRPADPTRKGYTFQGWYADKALTKVYDFNKEVTKDLTIYAKWKENGNVKPKPAKKTYGVLLAKMTADGKKSMTISWNKVKGVKGYDIFFARCDGKGTTTAKKVKTVKAGQTLKWTKTGLQKKTAYKAYVKAYITKNGKKQYVRTSPLMHTYTSGASKKYSDAKALTVNKTKVTLKKGKTSKIKAKITKVKKSKKLMPDTHVPTLRYLSSNTKIATVSKGGTIKAKAKGTCKVYVYAHNGVSKAITVIVK